MKKGEPELKSKKTAGAQVRRNEAGNWHLEIPGGEKGVYRLAQLDDYSGLRRRNFPWRPPASFSLRARASSVRIPGTWGFGLWNDPFGMAILRGVEMLRLPSLPNNAWYFFASEHNYLSLRDDLPANGAMAATFHSSRGPLSLATFGLLALPLFFWRGGVRLLRRIGRRFIREDSANLSIDPTEWHRYDLQWGEDGAIYRVDGEIVLSATLSPEGPLGLVIWVDNQYAAFPPGGKARFGTLANTEPAWIEVADISFQLG